MINDNLVSNAHSLYQQMIDDVMEKHFLINTGDLLNNGNLFSKIASCETSFLRLTEFASENLEPLQCKCIKIIKLIDDNIKQFVVFSSLMEEDAQNIKRKIEYEFFKIEKLEKEIEFLNEQCKALKEKIESISFKNNESHLKLKPLVESIKSAATKILENNKKIEEEVVQKFYEKITTFGTALETLVAPKAEEAPKKRCQFGRRLLPFIAYVVSNIAVGCYISSIVSTRTVPK